MNETLILEIIFVTITEYSYIITDDTQMITTKMLQISIQPEIAVRTLFHSSKTTTVVLSTDKKPLSLYFEV